MTDGTQSPIKVFNGPLVLLGIEKCTGVSLRDLLLDAGFALASERDAC